MPLIGAKLAARIPAVKRRSRHGVALTVQTEGDLFDTSHESGEQAETTQEQCE